MEKAPYKDIEEMTCPLWDAFAGKEFPKAALEERKARLAEFRAAKGTK